MSNPSAKEIKETSEKGLKFLMDEEGCVLHPYRDKNGVWTIGVGCTYWPDGVKVKSSDKPISQSTAISLFQTILKHYELGVWSMTRDDINQNQFDALTSFCFNIGVNGFKGSTVLKRLNKNPLDPRIKEAFCMWHTPDLLGRRKREAALYFS